MNKGHSPGYICTSLSRRIALGHDLGVVVRFRAEATDGNVMRCCMARWGKKNMESRASHKKKNDHILERTREPLSDFFFIFFSHING